MVSFPIVVLAGMVLGSTSCVTPSGPKYADGSASDGERVGFGPLPEPGPSPLAAVAPTSDGWFDPNPLLVSLRVSDSVAVARRVGSEVLSSIPLHDVFLYLDPKAGVFDVEQESYVTNAYGTRLSNLVFRLHGNPSEMDGLARVRLTGGSCATHACRVTQGPPSVINVSFDRALEVGERVRVRFSITGVLERVDREHRGILGDALAGMLRMGSAGGETNYGTMSVDHGFVSMGSFFPVLAGRDDDGWKPVEKVLVGDLAMDELSHVRARIETPSRVRIVAPGVVVRKVMVPTASGPRQRVDVAASMVRDFPVYAGEEVDTVERRAGDVLVRSTFHPGHRDMGVRAADVAAMALSVFERRFGSYPYRVIEVVEAPLTGGAGGVEYSGVIAVSSSLYRSGRADAGLARMMSGLLGGEGGVLGELAVDQMESTVAHEVAHQWWHALVGSDSRANPFVDESLAQYSTLVYFEDRYGVERAKRMADAHVKMNYLVMRMLGQPDGAVRRRVSSFDPMAYAGLVYGKGPFFFGAARALVGDVVFFDGLRRYVDAHWFRTANENGPVPYLAMGEKKEAIEQLARHWLDQANGDADLGMVDVPTAWKALLGVDAVGISPGFDQLLRLQQPSAPGGVPSNSVPSNRSQPDWGPSGSAMDPWRVLEQVQQMLDRL